ncbi:aminoglycoside 6-adenylyltransferase [Nocardia puris]|uniref:Aminoglycoside 6-adenylyltransferase n=2 Tax=Nocardia puris TaxID=208602 RepID=A0A366CYN7_9NOCA|nr:aminoglycoside 6-adenylyltransferase [Nocardia puris]
MSMEDADALLTAIVSWARGDDRITALIQTGSRARGERVDEYSDLDLEIITPHWRDLHDTPDWIGEFGSVLLRVMFEEDDPWPAPLLVVYAGGRKVDFTIAGEERLADMARDGLDDLYKRGYLVHLDRTGIAARLPAPRDARPVPDPPSAAEFREVTDEFWFEATQVPIYLNRGELWVAKFRDNTMKECLLRMLEWYAVTDPAEPRDPWYLGHHMPEWLPAGLIHRLHDVFGRFDAHDSWRALDATVALFADVSAEVAARQGFSGRSETVAGVRGILDAHRARWVALDSARH